MTGTFVGAIFAFGMILIVNALHKPRIAMADQILPFIGKGSTKSSNFTQRILSATSNLLTTRNWSPWSTSAEISKWLQQAESDFTLAGFRRKQIVYAGSAMIAAIIWVLLRLGTGKDTSPFVALLVVPGTFVSGGWFVKWSLVRDAKRRRTTIEDQLPAVLELLAFAVSAGEPVLAAIRRISRSCTGPLIAELGKVVDSVNSGEGLALALNQMSNRIDSQPITRAAHAVELALERGTPLTQVLRAQAADARAHQIRTLLVLAGHKETSMMLPVVFLILPMIVAVALYPGMIALQVL